jgi:hypothetical protein
MPRHVSSHPKLTLAIACLVLAGCAGGPVPASGSPGESGLHCPSSESACGVVLGYSGNRYAPEARGATIAGGGQAGAPNQITGDFGAIGGGKGNVAGEASAVGGGAYNRAEHVYAFVGGGANNVADGWEATVAGGYKNTASGRSAVVGGGTVNVASGSTTTVSGGSRNTANFNFAAVCGGIQNAATSTAAIAAGGEHNLARRAWSAVLGGVNNEAGYAAAIGGGAGNVATGSYSAIPGGFANRALSDYSFAAGRRAQIQAKHPGVFLFADSEAAPFQSLAPNEFAVRAGGGVRLVTAIDGAGQPLSGVRLSPGSGSWETLSDAGLKSGMAMADGAQVLDRLMALPIGTWSYRGESPSVRHIGPTAQDFRQAFGLGESSNYISTVDADGVALAAIQELYRRTGQLSPSTTAAALEGRLQFSNMVSVMSLLVAAMALWKARRRDA